MKKALTIMVAFVMMFSLAACTEGTTPPAQTSSATKATQATTGSSDEVVTVSFDSWSNVDSGWLDCYKAIYEKFDQDYGEKIKINAVGNSYADTLPTMLLKAAGGNTPDVAMVKAEWLPGFLEMDCLADMKPYISEDALADYGEASLSSYTTSDGSLIAIPYFGQPYALFYNKVLLEKAHVEVPTTFDELLAASAAISALGTDEQGNKIYGLGLANSNTEVAEGYNIFPWMWARGGEYKDRSGKIALNSAANLKAFQEIQNLYATGQSPKGAVFKELRNLFGTGNLGFLWDLQSQTVSFCEASPKGNDFVNDIGAIPIPGATAGESVGYVNDVVLVIFKSCKNMEQAGVVAEFLGGEKTIQIMYDFGKGKMSSRKSVMDHVFADVDELTAAYVAAMKQCRSLPAMDAGFNEADIEIDEAISRLAIGEDPAKVLSDLDATVKELYGQ